MTKRTPKPKKPKAVMGRPTSYTPEVAIAIIERLAQGEGLVAICRSKGMPDRMTWRRWIDANYDDLRARYARAREEGADARFEDMRETAAKATPETVNVARLQIDTEKWSIAKLKPGTYGDKLDLNVAGGLDIKSMDDETMNARLEAFVRSKLEPLFAADLTPNLEACLAQFRFTPLPKGKE